LTARVGPGSASQRFSLRRVRDTRALTLLASGRGSLPAQEGNVLSA